MTLGQQPKLSTAEILRQARAAKVPKPMGLGKAESHLNVEFKARCKDFATVKKTLESVAVYKGRDRQIDTYFNVVDGRLKLREGNIEHCFVYYRRDDTADSKESQVTLYHQPPAEMKEFLTKALGIKVVVDKTRDIYFIGNVKIHLDSVVGLAGNYIEVEAIDTTGTLGREKLHTQCEYYKQLFDVRPTDLLQGSYSDFLINGIAR